MKKTARFPKQYSVLYRKIWDHSSILYIRMRMICTTASVLRNGTGCWVNKIPLSYIGNNEEYF